MLVEEYRLHTELFGRSRFLLFPLFVTAVAAGGIWLLELTGSSPATIVAGIFGLVFFFGLQVGTLGLVGRDAMRDVLGDVTLLVFSARTLPVSRRYLLGVFILKDILYYAVFFLTPIVVGFLPLVIGGEFALSQIPLLWLTVAATFALGAGTSLAAAGVGTRSRLALLAAVTAVVAGTVLEPELAVAVTPYALYGEPTPATAVLNALVLVSVLVAGPLLFEPTTNDSRRRTDADRYRQLRRLGDSYTTRTLLEVSRSSGSVWKVAFSLGILFAVGALLLDRLAVATALDPSAGVAFGTLLGLGTFTTYNWVTQVDSPREHLRFPADFGELYRGKLRAFLVLAMPVGTGYLGVASLWYPPGELLLGLVVFPLVSLYVFGLTAFLTGLSPNELLFDTPRFAVYGAGLAALGVPLLVAALAYGTAPRQSAGIAVGLSAVAAIVGVVLVSRTGNRWQTRLRGD